GARGPHLGCRLRRVPRLSGIARMPGKPRRREGRRFETYRAYKESGGLAGLTLLSEHHSRGRSTTSRGAVRHGPARHEPKHAPDALALLGRLDRRVPAG